MSENVDRNRYFKSIYKNALSTAPIITSLLAVLIAFKVYRMDYFKKLPLFRVAYATVERNEKWPALSFPNRDLGEDGVRESHFGFYFYSPLKETLGSGIRTVNSFVTMKSANYENYRAVEFLFIENIHNATSGRIYIETIEISRDYPPNDLLKSLPNNHDANPPLKAYNRIELAGIKSGEIIAIPIKLTKPKGDLDVLFNAKDGFKELQIQRIIYYDETQTVPTILIPRSPLEYRSVISITKEFRITATGGF